MMPLGLRFLMIVFALMAGTNAVWSAAYWKIRVVAVDADGGETAGTVIAGQANEKNSLINSNAYSGDYTMPTVGTRVQRNLANYCLCAKEPADANFLGWYKDSECTQQLSPDNYLTQSSSFVTTSTTEADVSVTTIYALFSKPKKFWKVRVVAVDADGGATAGTVIAGENKDSEALRNSTEFTTDYTVTGSQIYYKPGTNNAPYPYVCAKAPEGTYFLGWYSDAACTEPALYTASLNWSSVWKYMPENSLSETEADAPVATFYALFTTKKYYSVCQYAVDPERRGAINKSNSNTFSFTPPAATSLNKAARGPVTYTNMNSNYVSQPARGWAFSKWVLTGGDMGFDDPASETKNQGFRYYFTASSTDENNPTVNTISAEYEPLPPFTVTVQHIQEGGSISFSVENWFENAGHDALTKQTVALGTASTEETEKSFTVYRTDRLKLVASTAENHRFLGWYEDGVWKRAQEDWSNFGTTGTDRVLEARFQKNFSLYYAAQAESSRGGSVQVSCGTPITNEHPGTAGYAMDSTAKAFVESAQVTAYYKAVPDDGYVFVGWKKSPTGAYVSYNINYEETFETSSITLSSPTTSTIYAYFEKEAAYEAELLDENGNATTGTFDAMYSAAQSNYTIVLHRNIDLGATSLDIAKNIHIDFNNHSFTGTASNLVTVHSGNTVTFVDNSPEAAGGIRVTAEAASEVNAVLVNGSLNFIKGVVRCENTSSDASAQATGITVANGAVLNLRGGSVEAQANSNAFGVMNNGTANLTTGAVSATAASDAYGVLANAATNITWSVAVNATATTGNNAVGVLIDNASAVVSIDGGTINATATGSNAYGVWAKNAASAVTIGGNMVAGAHAGTATTAFAVKENGVVVNIATGRFKSNNTQDITAATAANLKLYGGYYVHNTALDTYKQAGVTQGDLKSGTKFYTEGYRYILSDGNNPNYVVATANGKKFSSLEDAILYANNNAETTMTIRMEVPEYTLPAGNYTIPANATLLLPKDPDQMEPLTIIDRLTTTNGYADPALFQKLTLQNGVHIDVFGAIEVGGRQHSYGQPHSGCPTGPYFCQIDMNAGSTVTVASGGKIYAWGFITGEGTIDARRGSEILEQFQVGDVKGGNYTLQMIFWNVMNRETENWQEQFLTFPVMTYFIQNIEVKTKYHPGAMLRTNTGFGSVVTEDIKLIGVEGADAAMFLMDNEDDSEDTWVCKYYDAEHDQQVYEVNNAAKLGGLEFTEMGITLDSRLFILPITSNMKIHLLSGHMGITQDILMLPGAEIEVNKQSVVSVNKDARLFFIDSDEWGTYIYSNVFGARIKFRPDGAPTNTNRDISSAAAIGDAKLNIHGEFVVKGAIYTSTSGASIFSSNADAGTISFAATAPTAPYTVYFTPNTTAYTGIDTNPATLLNGNGTTVSTSGISAGTSYCYINGAWRNLDMDSCFVVDKADPENWKYFAKPADYVELKNGNTANADHTYTSKEADPADERTFICMHDCQWWEVENVEENDALKHSIHPDNDKYYYWDGDDWTEKDFTITWVTKPYDEEDKGLVVYDNADYKSMPKYLGTNPTRPMNDYYTYDFVGWTPELEPVTDDAIYTAVFQQNDRKYMITFLDADGSVLEEALWKMGEVPVCKNQPTPAGKILTWVPTIRAVTGDATYTATYTDEEPSSYEITFVNWDGTELQTGSVDVGSIPVYAGATPTKPAIADKAFEFDGWTPDIAAVSEAVVYTAKFREKPATYTITFKRAVGNEGVAIEPAETIQVLENVPYGEMPVCTSVNVPTKASTEAEYYTLVWTPTIGAVTGNATYTATGFAAHKNTCRVTVSAGANGSVTLEGNASPLTNVYEYGHEVTIRAIPDDNYHFLRWSDGNTVNPRNITVNAAITLKAEFAINTYTITWLDYDDSSLGTSTVNHGEIPTHAVPARATSEGTSYTFDAWTPAVVAATANATYKATYTSTQLIYTIRFVLNNGLSDVVRSECHYGDAVSIGNPVKATQQGIAYNFIGWKDSKGNDYAVGTTLPNVTNNEIYYAQYETVITNLIAGNSEGASAKDIIITQLGTEATALIIEKDGTVNIPVGTSLTVEDFVLESNTNQSGQLIGGKRLTATNAYFDVTLNTQPRTWYAVAVPWEVDAEEGIFLKDNGRHLTLGRDFDVIWYDAVERATNGDSPACWKYVEYQSDKSMHAGQLYMMYFDPGWTTIRFKKKDGADIVFDDDINMELHSGNGIATDANWNGIANPSVCHAYLETGATYGQVLNNGNLDDYFNQEGAPVYSTIAMSSYKFVVGKPVFVQATANEPVVINPAISGAFAAPQRANADYTPASTEVTFAIHIAEEGKPAADNLFVQATEEEKADMYVIGQDLTKGGVAKKAPQLWVNRYNTKLSVNTQELRNYTATYPLGISVPAEGDYTINVEETDSEHTLYLTLDGRVIWNLSMAPYTNQRYGLRLVANAPQVVTGIENALINAQSDIRKVIIHNEVFIIRGEKVYTITGQEVK